MSSDINVSPSPLAGEGWGEGAQATTSQVDNIAIRVSNLSKCYTLYDAPRDRLKQFILPRLQRVVGKPPRNYYREFWALNDVSFEVKKGETVGIIGRNGSGKSTLLQSICGTLTPNRGRIEVTGRISALLELGAGFNVEFSGRENVYMNGAVLGLSRDQVDTRFADIVAFANIGDFIDQSVKTYSSGMVVRLAFAVAIAVDPQILIVDEALAVGDELFQRKCYSRIEALKQKGVTILLVSHSASSIVELCDRAALLDDGELLVIGAPKIIVGKYQKLLYAPTEKRDEVRREISFTATSDSQPIRLHETKQLHSAVFLDVPPVDVGEFYEPGLVSPSRFEYESHGARIIEPTISTLQGQHVNNLVRGRQYKYFYRVIFDRPASGVRFGMVIKTTSGFSLGGALSAPSLADSIQYVEAGTSVLVEFVFSCYLNTGVYFLNAGVFGSIDQEETVLHRIFDAAAIRVMAAPRNVVTELIDFGFRSEITINA